jgi:hypothetical protein
MNRPLLTLARDRSDRDDLETDAFIEAGDAAEDCTNGQPDRTETPVEREHPTPVGALDPRGVARR